MMMRKLTTAALALLVLTGSARTAAAANKRVAFVSWNDTEPRYAEVKRSMLEQLEKDGFNPGNITFLHEDAKGDKKLVPEIIKKLQGANIDIYVPLGTSAAVPVAKEITDKPVVISMVYDPISAKLIADWTASGNNVTGSSNFVSIPSLMRRIIKRSEGTWKVKRMGVIYTPGEKNAELQLAAVRSVEKELGLEYVDLPVAKIEDVATVTKAMAGKVDMIYVTGSNVVGTNIAAIIEATVKNKILTVTHLDDLVERGVLIGLVAGPTEVGRLGGLALVKVLKGAKPTAVAVAYPLPKLLINRKTVDAGKFAIPPALEEWAKSAEKI